MMAERRGNLGLGSGSPFGFGQCELEMCDVCAGLSVTVSLVLGLPGPTAPRAKDLVSWAPSWNTVLCWAGFVLRCLCSG